MFGICFSFDIDLMVREYWSYIFEHFEIIDIWELNRPSNIDSNYYIPIAIYSVSDLPTDSSIVIASHKNAKYLQGTIPLVDFIHPTNAIYIFGSDANNLYPEMFKDMTYQTVYIPGSSNEMHSFQAGAMFMYDRMVKNG